tara:strand:- start:275 stop:592 length:318 start_codon:yes stop_codon:yes gene_type:complete
MADKTQGGANITALKADISAGVKAIEGHIEDRTSANQAIAAVKADLEAKGVHKKALNMAMQYMNMDPDKREGFDIAYDIVREAIGLPVTQGELFEAKKPEKSSGD